MNNSLNKYMQVLKKMESEHKKLKLINECAKLIVVTKTFGENEIMPILKSGHCLFGENKVQEAQKKWNLLRKKFDVELHLIGPLQSNKVKLALETFDAIQTIDREKIAKKISLHITSDRILQIKPFKFFIQINTGNEVQKSGCKLENAKEFILWCKNDLKLNIYGLMCIPPLKDNPGKHFKILRSLAKENRINHTSMGMTSDYLQAIQFGASYVRVGSAIFGKR